VREGARHHLGVYGGWDQGSDTPGHGFFLGDMPDEKVRHMVPVGTPDEVLAGLRPMVEAFADRPGGFTLVVRLHYPGMPFSTAARAVEVFGEKVLPGLQAAVS
jgi:hypothetical protein